MLKAEFELVFLKDSMISFFRGPNPLSMVHLMLRSIVLATLSLVALTFEQRQLHASIIIRMDDLTRQPVNGLVHPSGVRFGFTVGGVANLDAQYASGGPGTTTFISDPSIEGTASGVLDVIFPDSFNQVKFGLAVSLATPTFVNVELFNSSNASLGVTPLNLTPLPTFSENQFNYSGVGISRFRVDLTPSSLAPRFAFDNLILDNVSTVPEPTSFVVFLLGSFLSAAGAARRR